MRFLLGVTLLCVFCLGTPAVKAALPEGVSLSVHGEFDPGATGGTAVNSDNVSTLSIQTATLVFDSSDVDIAVAPGDLRVVTLGSLYAVTGQLQPVPFGGATLDITLELNDPPAMPSTYVYTLQIAGNVGEEGETILLVERTGEWADFLTAPCLPRIVAVKPEALTQVVSGAPPEELTAVLRAEYSVPVEPGDIDGDGNITLIDAVRGLQMLAGIDESQCDEVERGDIEGSGQIDLANVVRIARKAFDL